jgi:hypothetical protein
MPRWTDRNDAWDDEPEDDDWPDDDGYPDDDEPTVPCPYCGREIHEESPRCPYCGNYLSAADAPPPRKPWWLVVGVVVCLYAVYRWIVG